MCLRVVFVVCLSRFKRVGLFKDGYNELHGVMAMDAKAHLYFCGFYIVANNCDKVAAYTGSYLCLVVVVAVLCMCGECNEEEKKS